MAAGMAAAPGPANLFCIATGLEKGPRAGLIGVLGLNMGSFAWFIAAALGLGVLMVKFPALFGTLAVLGGLYLAWLGLKAVRAALDPATTGLDMGSAKAANRPFLDGFVVQATNPKALLMFTAVIPPFIDMSRAVLPQLAMFGAGIFVLDLIIMSLYALAGAALAVKFGQPKFARIFSGCIGAILMTTAVLVLIRATS
jgi:threonine/homoserine/homoserine lactone efflux protein